MKARRTRENDTINEARGALAAAGFKVEDPSKQWNDILKSVFALQVAHREFLVLARETALDLIARVEDAEDLAAIDRGQRGGGTYLPGDQAMRIIDGESPWRVWREHRGLTLDQVARRVAKHGVKVTKGQLSHVENGRSQASLALASAVAKALEISLDSLAP